MKKKTKACIKIKLTVWKNFLQQKKSFFFNFLQVVSRLMHIQTNNNTNNACVFLVTTSHKESLFMFPVRRNNKSLIWFVWWRRIADIRQVSANGKIWQLATTVGCGAMRRSVTTQCKQHDVDLAMLIRWKLIIALKMFLQLQVFLFGVLSIMHLVVI